MTRTRRRGPHRLRLDYMVTVSKPTDTNAPPRTIQPGPQKRPIFKPIHPPLRTIQRSTFTHDMTGLGRSDLDLLGLFRLALGALALPDLDGTVTLDDVVLIVHGSSFEGGSSAGR